MEQPANKTGWRYYQTGCAIIGVIALVFLIVLFIYGLKLTRLAYLVPAGSRQIKVAREDIAGVVTDVSFSNSEGHTVKGWYIPAETEPGHSRDTPAILMLHGLGGTRAQLLDLTSSFTFNGWGVLLIDQRGHGEHSARYTTFGRAESLDALAAVDWLRNRSGIDAERIGIYGASMGATTAIYAASEDPDIAGVVADSSYASFREQASYDLNEDLSVAQGPGWLRPYMLLGFRLLSPLVIGKWANYPEPFEVVSRIECPLFLIHGENDQRIPADSFRTLADAAESSGVDLTKWLVPDEGHCSYMGDNEYRNRLVAFFRGCFNTDTE